MVIATCAALWGCSGNQTDQNGLGKSRVGDSGVGSDDGTIQTEDSGADSEDSSVGAGDIAAEPVDSGLNPKVAPGGNFDLSAWQLQEPVGSPGSPTEIPPAKLEGPNGYQDSYFYTDPTDGAMTFWDPEDGVTTANSSYPRSELREMGSNGAGSNWPIAGTNILSATLEVVNVPDHVCVGQIHIGAPIEAGVADSTKPLLELYYGASGDIVLGIENSPSGGQATYPVATVPLGTKFSYSIQLTGSGAITLTVNGSATTYDMPTSFSGYGMYFKAGDYDQSAGSDAGVGATVKFYALEVSHTS